MQQNDLLTLFDTMIYSAEFPEGFRAAVELRGFQMGQGRQPITSEQKTDISTLSRTLQCMLSEHGFTNEPIGGCATGITEELGNNDVSQIVQRVVAELNRRNLL